MHQLLSPGNLKLGRRGRIWGFGLPSARPDVCVGMSELCRQHCYARRIERFRRPVLAAYERNLRLSRTRHFVPAVVAFIQLNEIEIVRIHTGGDFFSPAYARKWLQIMRRLPDVRFYVYSRSWRAPQIIPLLEEMAAQPNCRLWFSCDEETGLPESIPPRVRIAWLMTTADERPTADLIFRVQRLRREPVKRIGLSLVCPTENGTTTRHTDCERCGNCWQ